MGMGRKGTIPLLKIHSVLHHLKYASAHLVLTNTQNEVKLHFTDTQTEVQRWWDLRRSHRNRSLTRLALC